MSRRPPRSTQTDTLCPSTTLFRSRTMQVAQKLYEGVALGDEGTVGLISYMRTDSVNLSLEAVGEIRDVIARDYGTRAVPDQRSEEHTSELQSLMRISYAVFRLKKKKNHTDT